MSKKVHFSLNWGKGAMIVALVVLACTALFSALMFVQASPQPVAIEWGELSAPMRIKEPVLPPTGSVAIEWGELSAPMRIKEPVLPPSGQVAIEWGELKSNGKPGEPPCSKKKCSMAG